MQWGLTTIEANLSPTCMHVDPCLFGQLQSRPGYSSQPILKAFGFNGSSIPGHSAGPTPYETITMVAQKQRLLKGYAQVPLYLSSQGVPLGQCFSTLVLGTPTLHILYISLIKHAWFDSWAQQKKLQDLKWLCQIRRHTKCAVLEPRTRVEEHGIRGCCRKTVLIDASLRVWNVALRRQSRSSLEDPVIQNSTTAQENLHLMC